MGVLSRGLGGGGSMFAPAISPWPAPEPDQWFVGCDLLGLYRSTDRGHQWTLLNARQVTGGDRFTVAFDPTTPGRYVAHHVALGLRERAAGASGWTPFGPSLPAPLEPRMITAAAFRPTNGELILGTTQGIYRQSAGTWTRVHHSNPLARSDDPDPMHPTLYETSDVLAFAFFVAGTTERLFAATTSQVLESTDGGSTWTVIGDTLAPNGGNGLPHRDTGPAVLPDDTRASGRVVSGIRGFAAGPRTNALGTQVAALWVTIEPNAQNLMGDGGGVFYTEPSGATTQWARAMGSGTTALPVNPSSARYGIYERLAVASGNAGTVFVTGLPPSDDAHWVSRGVLAPGSTAASPQVQWTGIYDGFQNHTSAPNVTNLNPPGWADLQPPDGLGWGFGGLARGFTVDPKSADVLMFTNQSVLHASENATSPAVTWAQRYTEPSWHTVGLDVTTTWQYDVNAGVHLLSSTDIGLARSTNAGADWTLASYTGNQRWGNFYQLAFPSPGGQTVFAAVSAEHDIPHDTEQRDPTNPAARRGAILGSANNGGGWSVVAGSQSGAGGLSGDHPVVSIIAHDLARASSPGTLDSVLLASVWGDGVYWSTGQGQQWTRLGTLPAGVHCYRLRLDPGSGDLFCNAAVRDTGSGLAAGALYRLASADWNPAARTDPLGAATNPITTAWSDVTTGIVTGGAVLNPVDFAFDAAGNIVLATADHKGTNAGGGFYRGLVNRTGGGFAVAWSGNLLSAAAFAHLGYPAPSLRPLTPAILDGWLYVPTLYDGIVASRYDTAAGWTPAWHDFDALPFIGAQRITQHRGGPDRGTLYLSTFGAGTWEVQRRCAFVTDHSTISAAEVASFSPAPSAPVRVDRVAYLVLDGYTEHELGLAGNPAPPEITVSPVAGVRPVITAATADPGAGAGTVCRRTYTIGLDFTDATAFPALGDPPQTATLRFERGAYSCSTTVAFVQPNRPYMLDGPVSWLSQDLRVFQVSDGLAFAGHAFATLTDRDDDVAAATAAGNYIRTVLAQLNAGQGQKVFEDENPALSAAERSQQLELTRFDGAGARVFNFALARVRWQDSAASNPTRVFFRMAPFPSGGFVYSLADSNRAEPPQVPAPPASIPRVPLLGLSTNLQDLVNVPCFADDRTTGALTGQPTGAGELPSIPAGNPTVRYFGCWLDFNQPRPLFPEHPATTANGANGPWTLSERSDFPTLLKGQHQCLVAEVHYDVGPAGMPADVLANGDTPGGSDHLSQRNLAINGIGNPGGGSTHTVSHPFAIRGARPWTRPLSSSGEDDGDKDTGLDELLIDWRNLPAATAATLTLSDVRADDVLALERARGGGGGLTRVDAETLGCRVGGATYVPIPPVDHDVPALLTLTLPRGVRYGESYGALVQQIGGPERAVLGAFEIDIPVVEEAELLGPEQDALAVGRYAFTHRKDRDRWTPILERHLATVAARVDGFGGDSRLVRPSLDGHRRGGGCLLALRDLLRALWDLLRALLGR